MSNYVHTKPGKYENILLCFGLHGLEILRVDQENYEVNVAVWQQSEEENVPL